MALSVSQEVPAISNQCFISKNVAYSNSLQKCQKKNSIWQHSNSVFNNGLGGASVRGKGLTYHVSIN